MLLREGQFFTKTTLKLAWKILTRFQCSSTWRATHFLLNDTLCLELKGTAKLLGVVFHTSFLSRFKAITPRRTTGCRSHCLDLLNKEQFGCFEPLYQANCCKSIAFWRQRFEIAPIISKKVFVASHCVFRLVSQGKVTIFPAQCSQTNISIDVYWKKHLASIKQHVLMILRPEKGWIFQGTS